MCNAYRVSASNYPLAEVLASCHQRFNHSVCDEYFEGFTMPVVPKPELWLDRHLQCEKDIRYLSKMENYSSNEFILINLLAINYIE